MRKIKKIIKIIKYIKLLWENEDWDRDYLMKLIIFKLERMERVFRSGMCESSPKMADTINEIIIIGNRILTDDYDDFVFDEKFKSLSQDKRWDRFVKANNERQNDVSLFFSKLGENYIDMWD